MPWLTTAIETNCFWTDKDYESTYDDAKFILKPETDELYPTVSIELPDNYQYMKNSHEIYHEKLKKFLSVLSWVKNCAIREITWGSSKEIKKMGKKKAQIIDENFNLNYLPTIYDEKALRALALFREAKSLNHKTYEFLGYFKILNILNDSGKDIKQWINDNVKSIKDNTRQSELLSNGTDIGNYLYIQGRCAIAHAFKKPVVNPDIVTDLLQIQKDLPLIEAFAKLAIEKEFHIDSSITNWAKNTR